MSSFGRIPTEFNDLKSLSDISLDFIHSPSGIIDTETPYESKKKEDSGFVSRLGVQAVLVPEIGVGPDFRFYQFRDWGVQVGAAYFPKSQKLNETLTASYSLAQPTNGWLGNVDLFAGGSYSKKTVLGGIRINLSY